MKLSRGSRVLSGNQLFAVLFCLLFGRSLIGLPTMVTKYAQQDGWISIIITYMIAAVMMNLILWFLKHFPDMNFAQMCEKVLGKYLGKIPGLLFFVYYLLFTSLAIRTSVDLASTWLLPRTPIEVLTVSILTLVLYLARNGIKIIGRFSEIVVMVILPLVPLFFVPVFTQGRFLLILPVATTGIVPILRASIPSFYVFLGFESLFILYSYARKDTSHKEVVKMANIALSALTGITLLVVIGSIMVFGPTELQFFLYPVLEYFKIVVLPVVERVEFVLIYFWTLLNFASIAVLFSLATNSLQQVFKLEWYKNLGFFLAIPVYFLLKVPQNTGEVRSYIEIFSYIGFASSVLVLGILLIVAIIRGRGRVQ